MTDPITPPPAERARLLVVDDIEMNRDLLVRRARRLGHDSGVAEDGVAALEQLRAAPWDLVLLDITMPRMDGYETLRRIKADPALAHIPVIMVSAIDETDSVVRCLELGADDYVSKPFNATILQARIEASLAKKRLADQKRATLQALARELEIGQRIQRGFLPDTLPALPGWHFAAHCEPARQVGGDFYDALVLPDGRVAFVLADVCDKGVGAALYMALFRTLLRALLSQTAAGAPADEALVKVLGFVNDYIAQEHGRDNMFATLVAGVLQPQDGVLHWTNLGHDAPMLRRASGQIDTLAPQGVACGMMPGLRPTVLHDQLAPGDALLMFTDGVTEGLGAAGRFGDERLLAFMQAGAGKDAQALVSDLVEALAGHCDGFAAHDDVTLMAITRAAS